jgi:RNA polymerase sigma-70 factor (ECF subfamily)
MRVQAEPGAESRGELDAAVLFGQVFAAEHSYVFHTLRRFGVRERDLEDVTHDVFVVVHRAIHGYDRARPIKPWLCAIAARVASDYRRLARNRNEDVTAELDARSVEPAADRLLEIKDAQALVVAALERVDETRRVVFVMVDIDELPVAEVAHALSIPVNTAYSRLRVAREEFAASVRRIKTMRGAA